MACCFIVGGPLASSNMTEMSLEAEGDTHALYYMFSMFFFLRTLINLIMLYLIGYFMELGRWLLM